MKRYLTINPLPVSHTESVPKIRSEPKTISFSSRTHLIFTVLTINPQHPPLIPCCLDFAFHKYAYPSNILGKIKSWQQNKDTVLKHCKAFNKYAMNTHMEE